MINPRALERVRTVEDLERDGTKVSAEFLTTQPDTIFPLQSALGYELGQTLMVKPDNLVVEGPADIVYLTLLSETLRAKGRQYLSPRWALVPAGGIDKIPAFVALFGSQLNVAVLLDVAAGGNQKINDLVRRGILRETKIFPITEFISRREADIEDLFDPDFYLELLRLSEVADLNVTSLPYHPRIVVRVEQAIGNHYDHFQPASYFLKHYNCLNSKIDEETLNRFEVLFTRLNFSLS